MRPQQEPLAVGERACSPEDVLTFSRPTERFLCRMAANRYGIEFIEFRIQEQDSKRVVFELRNPPTEGTYIPPVLPPELEAEARTVRYSLPASFLRSRVVRTFLSFKVGITPVQNFRMIERHYFKGRLLRSYDFTFGFVIPGSTNSWEALYETPNMTEEEIEDFVASPYEHHSDTFYFVGGELIMHNKALFSYYAD